MDKLYEKYTVRRTDRKDEPGGKHERCVLFVLDLTHDHAACLAALAYAGVVEGTSPGLASDLRQAVMRSPSGTKR